MDCELYKVVVWPECQALMGYEGWEEHSYLILDDSGLAKFGNSAYFVEKSWLDSLKTPNQDLQN